MNHSEQLNELAGALAKAQGEIQPAIKDSQNPYYKSSYADLSSVWSACREALSKNGLSVTQTFEKNGGGIYINTTLLHSSGQWMKSTLHIPIHEKMGPQQLGALITYYRRYSLASLVGVAPDDDDDCNSAKDISLSEGKITKADVQYIDSFNNESLKNDFLNFYKVPSFEEIDKKHYTIILKSFIKNHFKKEEVNDEQN